MIEGNLLIRQRDGYQIQNLTGLAQIITIKGNLDIVVNYSLENFNGLEALDSVYGNLSIGSNYALLNMDAQQLAFRETNLFFKETLHVIPQNLIQIKASMIIM